MRRKAINWTNVDQIIWCHKESPAHNGFSTPYLNYEGEIIDIHDTLMWCKMWYVFYQAHITYLIFLGMG